MSDWIAQLKKDLIRINKRVAKERENANEAIERLKELEEERENILDSLTGENYE
jgi:hypothetical protein